MGTYLFNVRYADARHMESLQKDDASLPQDLAIENAFIWKDIELRSFDENDIRQEIEEVKRFLRETFDLAPEIVYEIQPHTKDRAKFVKIENPEHNLQCYLLMRSLHFDTSLLLDQKQESLKPQKFYIVFGVSPKGARFLVTVHSAQYDWLEELKQKATFEGYMDYPYRLANLLYGILQRLVDSYQQMLYFTDQFMDDLEDAAREGVNSWRVPQRIRDIVVAAKERDFQDNKARKKDPEEIRRQREWSKQHKFAPKVRTKVQQSDEDYLQTIIFRTKRALSRMRDVMLPEDNAIHEFVIHAKYHASQKSEGDKLRIVDERLATYFEDLRQHLDVLDAMLQSRRDHLSELININMAMVSNRLNQIMHQLTRFAAIFLPITFITGFFGQNFWGTSGLLPFFTDPVQFLVLGMSTSLALIVGSYFFFNWYFNRGVKNTK